ncbi:MAG: carboxypeptidase regulatory-like domain-containing protein [Candidatus Pacebacteria bacterium]|nr:carboxypeptidase regulatory-like domain-containing protein [Candidatus Paceibacterota bacterium]
MNILLKKTFLFAFIIGAVSLFGLSVSSAEANIVAPNQYAQFLDIDIDNDTTNDIINFDPINGGVVVSGSGTTGYAWGETVGWINTDPTNGNVGLTCNAGTGTFSGYWWGENTGWINLAPTNGGLTINSSGEFNGNVWSENYGWINFTCPGGDTCVQSTYSCPGTTGGGGGTGGGGTTNASCTLSANQSSVAAGSPVVLSWTTNIPSGQYTSASISPIGSVNGSSGSVTVYPTSTTTYNASFAGNFVSGTATCNETVTVNTVPTTPIPGCTNASANNYNPLATVNNGSCIYPVTPPVLPPNPTNPGTPLNPGTPVNPPVNIIPGTPTQPTNPGATNTGINGQGGNSDNQNLEPGAFIVDDIYRVNIDDQYVSIEVRRFGPIDQPLDVILRIVDGTAKHGLDYDGTTEYYLHWNAGDEGDHIITLDILKTDVENSRRMFSAMLLHTDGSLLDDARIIIKGNPWLPLALAIAALLAGFTTLPFRIQNILLAIPAYRRKHMPWGVVYDSKTKEPLDPAYVQLFDEQGNEMGSAITDLDGRFGFLVEPGRYRLSSGKTNYAFPSEFLKGKENDSLYKDLYFGDTLEITEKGQVITKNIPMDPTSNENWNEDAKRKMKVNQFFNRHDGLAHRLIDVLFVLGLAISIYALVNYVIWYNILVVALYAVMIVIMILGVTGRAYGRVQDIAGRAIKGAVVRAFNATLDREVAHRIVGESGYYYMLVQNGEYYVTVEIPQEGDTYAHVHTSPRFKVSNGILKKNIKLE